METKIVCIGSQILAPKMIQLCTEATIQKDWFECRLPGNGLVITWKGVLYKTSDPNVKARCITGYHYGMTNFMLLYTDNIELQSVCVGSTNNRLILQFVDVSDPKKILPLYYLDAADGYAGIFSKRLTKPEIQDEDTFFIEYAY